MWRNNFFLYCYGRKEGKIQKFMHSFIVLHADRKHNINLQVIIATHIPDHIRGILLTLKNPVTFSGIRR